jgi:glyoxylase-like metal-dependent hydrolase (beta-lactamase superfamily II)
LFYSSNSNNGTNDAVQSTLIAIYKAKDKGNEFHKTHQAQNAIQEYTKALSYFASPAKNGSTFPSLSRGGSNGVNGGAGSGMRSPTPLGSSSSTSWPFSFFGGGGGGGGGGSGNNGEDRPRSRASFFGGSNGNNNGNTIERPSTPSASQQQHQPSSPSPLRAMSPSPAASPSPSPFSHPPSSASPTPPHTASVDAPGEDLMQLLTSLLSNRSVAYLGSNKYVESYQDADEVVRLRPDWIKGYFRRAEALLALRRYEEALTDFETALQKEPANQIIMERVSRTQIYIRDSQMGIVIHQLTPGREICNSKSIFAPIQSMVFDFAYQMRNIIHVIANLSSRQAMIIDPVWDIDGILKFCKRETLKVVGIIITHYHIDHVGGIPPPPYDRWGVRVEGLAKMLKKVESGVKVYVSPGDVEGILKANPELEKEVEGRFYLTTDGEMVMLPLSLENAGKGGKNGSRTLFSGGASSASSMSKETETCCDSIQQQQHSSQKPWPHHLPPSHSPTVTTFQFIHTPGHTPGSQCILVNNERLFTGDTLFIGSCGRVDFPDSSPHGLCGSLEKLGGFEDEVVVFPGHNCKSKLYFLMLH